MGYSKLGHITLRRNVRLVGRKPLRRDELGLWLAREIFRTAWPNAEESPLVCYTMLDAERETVDELVRWFAVYANRRGLHLGSWPSGPSNTTVSPNGCWERVEALLRAAAVANRLENEGVLRNFALAVRALLRRPEGAEPAP